MLYAAGGARCRRVLASYRPCYALSAGRGDLLGLGGKFFLAVSSYIYVSFVKNGPIKQAAGAAGGKFCRRAGRCNPERGRECGAWAKSRLPGQAPRAGKEHACRGSGWEQKPAGSSKGSSRAGGRQPRSRGNKRARVLSRGLGRVGIAKTGRSRKAGALPRCGAKGA